MNELIRICDIEKYYGSKDNITKAVNRVSFTVERGEYMGVMGPSGSGKTTLLNMLSTIDKVTSGHIYYGKDDITEMKEDQLADFRKDNLGFIFQDFNLLDTLTIEENIELALSLHHMSKKEITGRVKEIMTQLGIRELKDKFPYQVSGGQKQRCACARALVHKPQLIFADEPTGALDSKSAQMLLETFDTISRFLFYTALLYYICFAVILFSGAYTVVTIWFYLLGLVAASYLLFIGLSGFVVHTIVRKNKKIYKGANLFILRQLSSKIKTMSFTMGTLTVLFFAALVDCSVEMMFGDYQKKQLDDELPFDVIVFSDNPEDDFSAQLSVLKKETQITEQLIYQIYQDGTDTMNQYLYETLPYFDGKAPEFDEDAGTVSNYFSYDTYMKLSDYNSLRRMLGYSQISLGSDEYLIHTKERLKDNFREFQGTADSKGLICKGIYTELFTQSGDNGADYILVIPDESAAHITPFYSLLPVTSQGMHQRDFRRNSATLKTIPIPIQERLPWILYGDTALTKW